MGQIYGFLLLPGSFLIHGMKMWGTWDRHEIGSLGQRELCGWDIYLWRAIYFGNSMENERFQLQNVAKTVEMAASSSKMLQIARKTGRKAEQKKTKTKTIPALFLVVVSKSILEPQNRLMLVLYYNIIENRTILYIHIYIWLLYFIWYDDIIPIISHYIPIKP